MEVEMDVLGSPPPIVSPYGSCGRNSTLNERERTDNGMGSNISGHVVAIEQILQWGPVYLDT